MAWTDNVNHVQVVELDQAIEMDVNEIQPRRRAPMAKQARFEVFQPKRNLKQRVVLQIDLADGQVVCRTPIGVHLLKKFGGQRVWHRNLRAGPPLCISGIRRMVPDPSGSFLQSGVFDRAEPWREAPQSS